MGFFCLQQLVKSESQDFCISTDNDASISKYSPTSDVLVEDGSSKIVDMRHLIATVTKVINSDLGQLTDGSFEAKDIF